MLTFELFVTRLNKKKPNRKTQVTVSARAVAPVAARRAAVVAAAVGAFFSPSFFSFFRGRSKLP